MDLIPLCKDGVASAESCHLVEQHIAQCESCCNEYEGATGATVPGTGVPNEQELLRKLRRNALKIQGLLLIGGAVLGVSMTFSINVFLNFLLMPTVGALSFFVFRRRVYIAMSLIFALSLVSNTIYGVVGDGLRMTTLRAVFSSWIAYSAIYAFLVLIGWCIAWLLHYAFTSNQARTD